MALSIDGTTLVHGQTNNAASVSAGNTFTTATTNTIIIVVAAAEWVHAVGAAGTVSSVTGGGLTFAKRSGIIKSGSVGSNGYLDLEVWWAFSAGTLSGITFTVNYSLPSATNFESAVMNMFGVTGFTGTSYHTTPWDQNVALPVTASNQASSTPTVSGINTTNTNTMVIVAFADCPPSGGQFQSGGSVPAGFTFIDAVSNTSGAVNNCNNGVAFEDFSSAQSGVSAAWSLTVTNWCGIGDALSLTGGAVAGPGGSGLFVS